MANSTKATAGKTNNAKIARSFVFLFFQSYPLQKFNFSLVYIGETGKPAACLPLLSVTFRQPKINKSVSLRLLEFLVILQMSRNPGKAVLLHLRSYLQACRTGDTDHTHLRSCQEQLCGSSRLSFQHRYRS